MKTIAVVFGSRSTEHDVSVVTAIASVIKPLELTKDYRVEAVYIAKNGSWYWDDRLKDINLFSSGQIDDFLQKSPKTQLLFDNGLHLVKSGKLGAQIKRKIDVVFPATHGTYGEDGTLMGLLEMANVPYVGCNFRVSTVAMDKALAKIICQSAGIDTPRWASCYSTAISSDETRTKLKSLKFPLFVKPAHLGSSIGISRVSNQRELQNALEVAAHYDNKIVVEEEVPNLIEVTLPIMGLDNPRPALLERPLTKPEDFFDFDTKYMQGGKKGKKGGESGAQGYSELPAKLPKELYQKAEATGLAVYKALGCSGIARIDMLIDSKTKKVYFNEVNPLPGGLYAHNWRKAGVSSVELVTKLVELAEAKWQEQQRINTSFDTNYLKQF